MQLVKKEKLFMMKTNRNNMPSDPDALPQLVALYERLRAGEGNYVMFGQQAP